MKKEVKNAKIINVYTSFSKENLTLNFTVNFKYEGGGVAYSFSGNNPEDMFYFSELLNYTNSENEWLDILIDKDVRLVIGARYLLAIGHPTEDKFFRTRHGWDSNLSLSEI